MDYSTANVNLCGCVTFACLERSGTPSGAEEVRREGHRTIYCMEIQNLKNEVTILSLILHVNSYKHPPFDFQLLATIYKIPVHGFQLQSCLTIWNSPIVTNRRDEGQRYFKSLDNYAYMTNDYPPGPPPAGGNEP